VTADARISRRVQGFTESVIREMTRVVTQHGGVNLTDDMRREAGERLQRLRS
jgi:hypothetical protein